MKTLEIEGIEYVLIPKEKYSQAKKTINSLENKMQEIEEAIL